MSEDRDKKRRAGGAETVRSIRRVSGAGSRFPGSIAQKAVSAVRGNAGMITKLAKSLPWLTLSQAFRVARVATAVFFMAHAVGRIVLGTIPQFGQFMEAQGFPAGVAVVWLITIVELLAGLALIFRRWVRWAVVCLFAIAFGGVVLIHARIGWFVGEHGTGGSEYSVALIVLLILIAAEDAQRTTP